MRPGTILRWNALKTLLPKYIKTDTFGLDIGGFDGTISCNLKTLVPNLSIVVIDINKSGLEIAKEQKLETICVSALDLPFNDNQIDFILCLDLIEHIEEVDVLLNEMYRVLKKDGILILTTPKQNGVNFPFLSKQNNELMNINWGHLRKGFSLKEINKLFTDHKFSLERTTGYFNYLSRLAYRVFILSRISFKSKWFFYKNITKLEPYFKYGTNEHIIIGKAIKKCE